MKKAVILHILAATGLHKQAYIDPLSIIVGAGAGIGAYALSGKIKALRDRRILRLLLGLGAGTVAGYATNTGINALVKTTGAQPETAKANGVQHANEAEGRFLVRNAAIGQQVYRVTHNGNYAKTPEELTTPIPNFRIATGLSDKSIGALQGKPWGGYVLQLRPSIAEDGTVSDYSIIATPAPGFVGPSMQISSDEKIKPFEPN